MKYTPNIMTRNEMINASTLGDVSRVIMYVPLSAPLNIGEICGLIAVELLGGEKKL